MKGHAFTASPLIRLICSIVCAALLTPCLPVSYLLVHASTRPATPQFGDDQPLRELPDLDKERELNPPAPQADAPIPSRLAGWSPYGFNLNAPVNPISVNITAPSNGATFAEGTAVTITANASAGVGISAVSFLVNGGLIGTVKAAPYAITWNHFTAGSNVLTAIAQDKTGATATSTPVNITITGIGGPPTVSISSPANGSQFSAPASITVTANALAGSGRTISRVEFYAGVNQIGTATVSPYTVAWPNVSAGVYSLTARAVDNTGAATTSAAISITVSSGSALPSVSLTSPAAGATFTAPVNITLTANATASSGRSISRVDFYYGGTNLIGSATTAPYSVAWNNAPAGTHSLTARATDNFGATNTSSGVTITVNAGAAPTVNITSPSSGASYQAPATIAINAGASASSGRTITRVDFYSGANPINTDTAAPYSYTFSNVAAGTYTLTAKATDNTGASTTSTAVTVFVAASSPPAGDGFSTARLDPINRTGSGGEDLFSRNFNWSLPILSMPGRGGLDLGLLLAYNSLVWTRDGSQIKFNADNGFPGPGFRLGFPVVQPRYLNAQVGVFAYLLIASSGERVEFRQVGSTNIYESADSSYSQLTDNGAGSLLVRTAEGAQLSYTLINNEHRCTQIRDRNGNYITAAYDAVGRMTAVTDTLSRVVNLDYDAFGNLQAIWQLWNGVRHDWATFGWGDLSFQTNFSGLVVIGPQNGQKFPVLTRISFANGSRFDFTYNSWGQVRVITGYGANGHELNHIQYDLPIDASAPQSDCPRFTIRADAAENWNGGLEAATVFSFSTDNSWGQFRSPDGTIYKEFFGISGVQKGLTTQSEVWSGNARRKWTQITWTQDPVSYRQNPRIVETNIYDEAANRRRARIGYTTFNLPSGQPCSLPSDSYEYDGGGSNALRRTHTDYNLGSAYINASRRIIGLPTFQFLYDGDPGTMMSKVESVYDDGSFLQATSSSPVQHDEALYGSSFVLGRGNLSRTRRYDVNSGVYVESQVAVNSAGSVIFTRDPLGRQTTIDYADSFATTGTVIAGRTLAYPTTVTDPDGYSSTSQYDYDHSGVRRVQDPRGAVQTMAFDSAGRVARTDVSNGAYTRFVYPNASSAAQAISTYALIQSGGGEFFSERVLDGSGRVIASASDFPNSTGRYRAQLIEYDLMGRVSRPSNPTEINSEWAPAGDDAGWTYSSQQYDWKGRPTVTINSDSTAKEIIYGGCGCAGGQVVTIRDEMNRRQRMTSDVLGREVKVEILNLNQSVYSTRTTTYNARDQISRIVMEQGTPGSGLGQETLMTYDGQGRLASRKRPIESSPTLFSYNSDDTVLTMKDARGASTTYGYNGRRLPVGITYAKPANAPATDEGPRAIPKPGAVAFGYDEAGNRLWMTDGMGRTDYNYDLWSRLRSETRYINDLAASYRLSYDYNLAGGLTKLTDPFQAIVNYAYNDAGQLTGVTGSGYPRVTQFESGIQYRAWGGIKHVAYGSGKNLNVEYNDRLQMTSFAFSLSGPSISGSEFEYYADGRVRFAHDLNNSIFDRSYGYDHVGRLTEAKTGTEARGGTAQDGPYRQSYQYDAWDNMLSRNNRFWSQPDDLFTASYAGGRNTAWEYDDAGNLKQDTGMQHVYDVAGRQTRAFDFVSTTIDQSYDGDGLPVKRAEGRNGFLGTIYYIRSTVLGGQVVTELNTSGIRGNTHNTHVYVNGSEIAIYDGWINTMLWNVRNPVTGSGLQELDPLGGEIGFGDPFLSNPNTTYESLHPGEGLFLTDANPFEPGSGCELDGMPIDCGRLAQRLDDGTVALQITAGGTITVVNPSHSFGGLSGFWLRQRTESDPTSIGGDDGGQGIRIGVTDNAYTDIWVPLGGLVGDAARVSGAPQGGTSRSVDMELFRRAVGTCIPKLYSMFEMTSFRSTADPGGNGGKPNDDDFNGVVGIKDVMSGGGFNLVNDPTPPNNIRAGMISAGWRGATSANNPFWSYTISASYSPSLRAGENRYPELFTAPGMSWVRTQIHELGAALTFIRNRYYPGPYVSRLPDNGLDPTHNDDGPAMEDCVGRHYYGAIGLKSH